MSKLSQLHMELEEQASELGFEGLGEAEQAGYGVDWENGKLIKVEDELNEARKAWLKEREGLLTRLEKQRDTFEKLHYVEPQKLLEDTIDFIKRGEC